MISMFTLRRKSEKNSKYMHFNPVKRELVYEGIDWPWSSARFCAGLGMGSVVVASERLRVSFLHLSFGG
jgi:hypothetical protein